MGLVGDVRTGLRLVRDTLHNRRSGRRLRAALADRGPLERDRFEIGVYFADGDVNLYQLRQWYGPLAALARRHPVVVLARTSSAGLALVEESPLPVAMVRRVGDLERFLDEQPLKIVLYVNQNMKNFQMMRYGRRWHVFVNHGESDKIYMASNQHKAYDFAFIAGQAARDRLGRVLWDYDFDRRAVPIGRPQTDHLAGEPPFPEDERHVVLYAPTWEGDRGTAAYGSVASHGPALVEALVRTGRHRVVYRPHPRTGVVDPGTAQAHRRIVQLLESANRAEARAQHVVDTGAVLGWQLAVADVAICDISAMVYDRLATGRPLLVTRPVAPDAEVDTSGYLADAEWLDAGDAADAPARVDALLRDPSARRRLDRWVDHYFGDVTPGAATARFEGAIERLLAEWDEQATAHRP